MTTGACLIVDAKLTMVDSVVWAATELLPQLGVTEPVDSAILHPTCSMRHLKDVEQLQAVAAFIARDVTVPLYAECCGFAGDRGLLHKELTEAATAHDRSSVPGPPRLTFPGEYPSTQQHWARPRRPLVSCWL
ncbi:hypothetical protein [Streptomyces lancefieldiae]|uniref:Uncharacterized protein n=1 Tax=Streptomyces lancefieldiae TaxID=3075520 RepID=A0ABU3B263_9ACTN|nr:hypothetical protein [Streptomyces sp. DSM 40712]MDT0616160.1 hypothetical protein [Streptomyces sp. DSM 40712]